MASKDKVIELLEHNRGEYISGETMAQTLGLSRNSVWKSVRQLINEGYRIDSITGKGYRLARENDMLSIHTMGKWLEDAKNIYIYKEVDSTNRKAKDMAQQGAPSGTIVIAEGQTAGRGRMGRHFYSPEGTGIYLSVILKPRPGEKTPGLSLTVLASVLAAEIIEGVTGEKIGIKWVNDLYMRNKKIAGILTEASVNLENGEIEYIILGIGINVYVPDNGFPKDLEGIAGGILDKKHTQPIKNKLAAQLCNAFRGLMAVENTNALMEQYRNRSTVLGKKVKLKTVKTEVEGIVREIDNEGQLIFEDFQGHVSIVNSGEVSCTYKNNHNTYNADVIC